MTEVVGLFDNRIDAERAVADLYALGYDETNVGYVDRSVDEADLDATHDPYADVDDTGTVGEETAKGAGGGAIGGAAVGAGAGLLASAGMLLVPGIGPFLAAGTLAATLGATAAGAAGGAVVGGAAGAIFGAAEGDDDYADDETSMTYREGVTSGGSLVSVNVMDGAETAAADAMRAAGATKVDVYGEGGWVM
jgi:hypothetical protein